MLSSLEFGAFLAYSPRGETDLHRRSQKLMRFLKKDSAIGDPPRPISRMAAERLHDRIGEIALGDLFGPDVVLVPAPKSSRLVKRGLWVPQRIANALTEVGLGREVASILERVRAVPKAAFADPADRPKAATHYETIEVRPSLAAVSDVLIVDDVITRGATMIGAASRLAEAFPSARIRAFAMLRTVSNKEEFRRIEDPVVGRINLRHDGETRRDP